MGKFDIRPAFIDSAKGRIFTLLRIPNGAKNCVVVVPPFAEEMNKCRRQVTLTAEALAAAGIASLVFDLHGTGDSEGEFSDATWDAWKQDVIRAFDYVEECDLLPIGQIAVRLGFCLAGDALEAARRKVERTVAWQPVTAGKQFLAQFLRLRVAASMMQAGSGETVKELAQKLEAGEEVEVAGYSLVRDLTRGVENASFEAVQSEYLGAIRVAEASMSEQQDVSFQTRKLIDEVEAAGGKISGARFQGEPYWSSTEIVTNTMIVEDSIQHLAGPE